jgi:nucleotide-binding universal stress UspA family protein
MATSTELSGGFSSSASWLASSDDDSSRSRSDAQFIVRWFRRLIFVHRRRGPKNLTEVSRTASHDLGKVFMPKPRVLVVPVDFSPDMESTVSAALALARRHGAEVHLLEVISARGPSILDGEIDTSLRVGVRSKRDWSGLEHLIDARNRESIQVRTVAYRGDAAKVIPSYAQLVRAHLLVIGQHYGTPRWRRNTRMVSTLSRAAPGSVLVLPPGLSEKATSRPFTHIVSAVDFTIASAVAVRKVLDLIRRTNAQLTLVHALRNAPHRMVFSGGEAVRVARNLRGQAAQVAERLRKKVPSDVRIRVDARVTTGDPSHGIFDVASEVKADLIVLGVPPRSRLDEVLFGSTLRNVLRRTKIPVLVVPVPAGAYKWLE